jgi:hypothetical protein
MAGIKITDNVSLSTDLDLREGAPLLKAGIGSLITTGAQFFQNVNKPLDQTNVQAVALGGNFSSPSLLSGDVASLTAGAGMNCCLTVKKAADKLLFDDDGFSPIIPIPANQAWLGVEFDLSATGTVAASANGVGVSFEGDGQLTCATYTLFTASPPLPLLPEACGVAFSNFSLSTNASAIRKQLPGTVNVTEATGSITAAVSFEQPFAMNALASANLPFNESASIQPTVTLSLGASLQVAGDFLVRCYKMSDSVVRMGVYKKHGSTLTVTLAAGAGIEGKIGGDDVLNALLKAALPGVDVAAAGLSGDTAATLNGVVREGLSRNLSACLNAVCSAGFTHEAALLYDVQLDAGDSAETDSALGSALRSDWTSLEALPNARRIRNIAVETVEKKRSVTVNLFGFYSAVSTSDYLKTCTVLIDEFGQMVITDKMDASRISTSTSPYAADSDKLRQALMEDFLCTATYAVVSGKLNLNLSVMQSYHRYRSNMSAAEMREDVSLGYAMGLIPHGSLDATLNATPSFYHALVSAVVRYDTSGLTDIFYKDPASRTQRSNAELEQAGRDVMCLLLNPADPTDAVRLSVLRNNSAWAQMDEIGNTAAFGAIPELSGLGPTQLGVVTADWVSIVWWAQALAKIAPALSATTLALSQAPAGNPSQDAGFMKARAKLANVLGDVTRNTSAAFVHGWGAAVMFALSGRHGTAEMDLTWNSKSLHYE